MHTHAKLSERLGAVNMPVADRVIGDDDPLDSTDLGSFPLPEPIPRPQPPQIPDPEPFPFRPFEIFDPWIPRFKFCGTTLAEGCYTVSFTPAGSSLFSVRYRGTLRVERVGSGYRISGDLYRYRIIDPVIITHPELLTRRFALGPTTMPDTDEAADTQVIPVYGRFDYHSYLEGVSARMFSIVPKGAECSFTLTFDEWGYNHPVAGFEGSFASSPDRQIRWVMKKTTTAGLFSGDAYEGATKMGSVSIRHISSFFRKATLVIHTLDGGVAPAAVGSRHFDDIFADVGWDLSIQDGGTVSMPSTITGQSKTDCWSTSNLHRLMESVPGYNPDDLDTVWRSHLVAVQAKLGCSRGVMFDASGDLNNIAREGSATFSDDGYNKSHSPNFGAVEDEMQRDVPRAFLRSAAHEVGHAFNQIHQEIETSADNSLMTTTPSVANVLAASGQTFPNDINLGFNETVERHLRHLPDPAVRPGAMGFFGSAVNAPEPNDVEFVPDLEVTVSLENDRVRIGEPVELRWTMTNQGSHPFPVPASLEYRSLVSRISVTDPEGDVTFLRPVDQSTCSRISITELNPGESIESEAVLFYGRDGFTMTHPGKHTVEVIILWEIAEEPIAASGEAELFVSYPISDNDNQVASLLLDPDVGRAVAFGNAEPFERAVERLDRAAKTAKTHPACDAMRRLGLTK